MSVIRDAVEPVVDSAKAPLPEHLRRILEKAQEPVRWIIQDLIVRGDQIIIGAAPKAGKTLLATQLSLALASGGRFLRWNCLIPRRVLYINLEVSEAMFCRRIIAQVGGEENLANYPYFEQWSDRRSFNILDPDDSFELSAQIRAGGFEVVVIDVLARCHSDDENDNNVMKQVMFKLRMLVGSDVTSIVIHHNRKPPSGTENVNLGAQAMRGASAIFGEVDMAISLAERTGPGARYSVRFSARNCNAPAEILLDRDDATLTFFEAGAEAMADMEQAFKGIFKGQQTMSANDLKTAVEAVFKVKHAQAAERIRVACGYGWIEHQRAGKSHFYLLKAKAPAVDKKEAEYAE